MIYVTIISMLLPILPQMTEYQPYLALNNNLLYIYHIVSSSICWLRSRLPPYLAVMYHPVLDLILRDNTGVLISFVWGIHYDVG